jgi:hypothetical protein
VIHPASSVAELVWVAGSATGDQRSGDCVGDRDRRPLRAFRDALLPEPHTQIAAEEAEVTADPEVRDASRPRSLVEPGWTYLEVSSLFRRGQDLVVSGLHILDRTRPQRAAPGLASRRLGARSTRSYGSRRVRGALVPERVPAGAGVRADSMASKRMRGRPRTAGRAHWACT